MTISIILIVLKSFGLINLSWMLIAGIFAGEFGINVTFGVIEELKRRKK